MFDNSSLAGGKYCKVGKMTIQWFRNLTTAGGVIYNVAIVKHKQGDAVPLIDDEEVIRDLRSDGKLIRGPFRIMPTGRNGALIGAMDTVVLNDLLLDPNDDLLFVLNVTAATSGTNDFYLQERTWWKVVE